MSEEEALLTRARESLRAAQIMIREDLANIAASRAYYALFYVAEALLLSRSLAFSSHSAVIAAFGKEFSRSEVFDPKFHRYLIASQNLRQTGDYGLEQNVSLSDAIQVADWADEFLAVAETYLKRHNISG
jgi:uncharacterized protein (UPF0332 family)